MSEDIKAKALDIQSLLDYQKDSVVSREVIKKDIERQKKARYIAQSKAMKGE